MDGVQAGHVRAREVEVEVMGHSGGVSRTTMMRISTDVQQPSSLPLSGTLAVLFD